MTVDAIIFAGPTIDAASAAVLRDCLHQQPARQGDVWRAVRRWQPRAIGLIDGVFLDVPAVWHREILWAMSQGVHVFGAASMGALRAAELDRFGMRGIGQVYAAYRDGVWPPFGDVFEDDDEVAVIHAPAEAGGRALSDAMVDLRATLLAAEATGVISATRRDALAAGMKRLHFPHRSFAVLAEAAPELKYWLAENAVPQKRQDAGAMLQAMAAFLATDPAPFIPDWRMERALVWEDFVARSPAAMIDASGEAALAELRLRPQAWHDARHAALGRWHALAAGAPGDRSIDATRDAFRTRHRLWRQRDLYAWIEANALDDRGLDRLLQQEALLDDAMAVRPPFLDEATIDHLRVTGAFGRLLQRAGEKRAVLADAPAVTPGPSLQAALDWYFAKRCERPMPRDIGHFAADAGWESGFEDAVWREYLFTHSRPAAE